jgi:hypothetical protein
MQMTAKDDWMFEEPTVAEAEREATARSSMARAVADQLRAALPNATVLVVARGPGVPTGMLVSDDQQMQGRALDGVVLAELLAGAGDDRVTVALTHLLLGDSDVVEHTVARDSHGTVMGVIAVRTAGRVSSSWVRTALSRAGNSLAGWLAFENTWPPQTLLDALHEPALAHDAGIVLVANKALAHLLGRETHEVIGMPVSRITQRLATLRTCSLVVGGRPRSAIIFEGRRTVWVETSVLASLDRVLAERYSFLRTTTRISVDRRDGTTVAAPAHAVNDIVTVALLDATSVFATATTANHIRCGVFRDGPWIMFEVVTTGSLAHGPDVEHLGAVICAARARSLGGQFFLDASRSNQRVLRVALPVEA